ncbi:MAG: hypothetical protein ACJ8M1_10680 [Chthoniobacterales bacterium]
MAIVQVDAMALAARTLIRAGCENSAVHDPKKAVDDATAACKLDGWRMADYVNALAYASAANGDFNSAAQYERKAIDTHRLSPEAAKAAQQRLPYYEKRADR